MQLGTILAAVATLGALGLFFGALIALVHRRFHVWVDPRIEAVTALLPGSNCGACGFAGCANFAEGLIGGAAQPAGCTQLTEDDAQTVADYLGVAVGEANRRVARLLCGGGCTAAPQQAEYRGLQTCRAATAVAGGGKSCRWGCLGLADCAVACDYDAIYMNNEALAVVIPERCTACGDCVEACPKDLFVLMPAAQKLIVQCRSPLEGEQVEALCSAACNACGKCVLDAAPGLISIVNGLAVIDYANNELAAPEATARCPTGAIVWVEGRQFTARPTPALMEVS
jgi:Na+-translocating ferredoxin:NAD+ oxidoreductase RNF subunit RnfB